jgi:hypothetical protein
VCASHVHIKPEDFSVWFPDVISHLVGHLLKETHSLSRTTVTVHFLGFTAVETEADSRERQQKEFFLQGSSLPVIEYSLITHISWLYFWVFIRSPFPSSPTG